MAKPVPTSVRFDEAVKARLQKINEQTGIPIKSLIETALLWYVAEAEQLLERGMLPVAAVKPEPEKAAGGATSAATSAGKPGAGKSKIGQAIREAVKRPARPSCGAGDR